MFAPFLALFPCVLELMVKPGVFLEELIDDCIVLFVGGLLPFGLDRTADLLLEDGNVLGLFFYLFTPTTFDLFLFFSVTFD